MQRAIILYDADCGLCSWAILKLLRWDRIGGRPPRIRAAAIQSEEGGRWLADLSPAERLASWHLVDLGRDARISGGNAVAPLLGMLRFGTPLALLARLTPSLTRRAYDWVARYRTPIGRCLGLDACRVPVLRAGASSPG